ncbi:MAG: DUF1844 domain-containing protein [Acidobacteria bacterium]|nr:DUF1844 domain-containing protein [Acidobacteriota bacterium]
MTEKKEDSSGFKVVDRRGFASDGSRREEATEPQPPAPPAGPSPATERPPAAPVAEEDAENFGPTGFDTLISYLSTTALFQLGLLPGPGGEHIPPDLASARGTIDMLEVLQQKTHGNLSATETRMLEEVLYELRMSFVEMQKRLSQPAR